ncbi:hypothetical protein ABIF38_006503 [Bradyrhizobium japonicum]|jgi:hypothetical protein|uniref:Uncharacterized protein n=1 Tax=Bradyrhizobium elkanii TaxID=29448 RepID=A0ABV4F158_BRAEL|nr:hypothetical protein [Bradyrhizobium elkanii]MCS4005003.1 hypothetical protein [Bradyrhizobium elkanii USDA 61]MCP1731189.1 hypothetical protein [Bradyrhizobium elkanii]MCP1758172.1 hypothetical protein [Bradyrhizobium elkanii]MCP1931745.1 hypothetical protein [Bradyrhizobium elkanii]
MWDDYWFQLARFEAMKRRIQAGNELLQKQLAGSYERIRLSCRLLRQPDPNLSYDRADDTTPG